MTARTTRRAATAPGRIVLPGRADRLRRRALLTAGLLLLSACAGEEARERGEPPAEPSAGPAAEAPASGAVEGARDSVLPGSDVWLGTFVEDGERFRVEGLENVTRRPGYDNQPAFHPERSGFYYTRMDAAGGTDIWWFDGDGGELAPVTETDPESEYSATPLPYGGGFSAVVVEADSAQRLWRYGWNGSDPRVLVPDVEPVGYHGWAGEGWIALFVLGDPPTLQLVDTETGDARLVASNIGRSIRSIPDTEAVSYIQLTEDGGAAVTRWPPSPGDPRIVDAVDGGEFHAWTPRGTLLMTSGRTLWAWRDGWDGWRAVHEGPEGATLTRIDVSNDGTRIALVVEAAAEE